MTTSTTVSLPSSTGSPAAMPAAPSLWGAARAAFSDFYFNSLRLVAANLVWGLGIVALYVVTLVYWPAALILAPLLALPTVGVFRMAALIVRGESVSFWDGVRAWRQFLVPGLLIGAVVEAGGLVLLINLAGGLQSGDLIGWAFATLAGWGLVVGWLWVVCFWALLADPRRQGWGLRGAARAAGYLVIAHPLRLGALGFFLAIFLVASAFAFAALVTVSIAFGVLMACRYVLPAADRLEMRLAAAGLVLAPGRITSLERFANADSMADRMPRA